MLTKILATCLEKVIPDVVLSDQTVFIQGDAHNQILKLFNIIHLTWSGSTEVVISLDAEKALDRVEWKCLFLTFQYFGFRK